MKKPTAAAVIVLAALAVAGCESRSGSAVLGGVGGAAVGAGGYEYHLNRQKQRVEQDRESGKINEQEASIRLDQIRRDSLIQ